MTLVSEKSALHTYSLWYAAILRLIYHQVSHDWPVFEPCIDLCRAR
jgi:hypothetical protein